MGLLYDPDRLKSPMISTGARGEASSRKHRGRSPELCGREDGKDQATYGPEALALFVHGSTGSHFQQLFSAYGSPNVAMPSFAQCRGPREVGYELTSARDPVRRSGSIW